MKLPVFLSKLAPFIEGFILEKRACGYSYEYNAYILEKFDKFVIETGHDNGEITQVVVEKWAIQLPSESRNYRNQRVNFVRMLAEYMISLGMNAYLPKIPKNTPPPDPYILTKTEVQKFLKEIDNYKPNITCPARGAALSVLFRLYICCGIRLSEGTNLLRKNIDLNTGIIRIIHSKGDKDRKVFMSSDLTKMCKCYDDIANSVVLDRNCFFISNAWDKTFHKTCINRIFRFCWKQSGQYRDFGKNPSVHSLRHTYTVNCIHNWLKKGIDIWSMMPYLSRQLGHSSVDGTYYYYHTTIASLELIKSIDKASNEIIPKVNNLPLEDNLSNDIVINSELKTKNNKPKYINPANCFIPKVEDCD
jgi:integrase